MDELLPLAEVGVLHEVQLVDGRGRLLLHVGLERVGVLGAAGVGGANHAAGDAAHAAHAVVQVVVVRKQRLV